MHRSAPVPLVVAWFLGVVATGFWVVVYVGFLALSGLDGEGEGIYSTRYFWFLIIVAAAWVLSIVIASVMRSRRGIVISTIPLLFTAASAVGTTFFGGQLAPLFG